MNTTPEIFIKQGLNELKFEAPIEIAMKLFGEADEIENLSIDTDESTTVLHYTAKELTLFFEEINPILSCVEIRNERTLLFGEKVFTLNEREIVELMTKHNFVEQNIEEEAWGEKRVSFDDAVIDFYFEDDTLLSVVFGK